MEGLRRAYEAVSEGLGQRIRKITGVDPQAVPFVRATTAEQRRQRARFDFLPMTVLQNMRKATAQRQHKGTRKRGYRRRKEIPKPAQPVSHDSLDSAPLTRHLPDFVSESLANDLLSHIKHTRNDVIYLLNTGNGKMEPISSTGHASRITYGLPNDVGELPRYSFHNQGPWCFSCRVMPSVIRAAGRLLETELRRHGGPLHAETVGSAELLHAAGDPPEGQLLTGCQILDYRNGGIACSLHQDCTSAGAMSGRQSSQVVPSFVVSISLGDTMNFHFEAENGKLIQSYVLGHRDALIMHPTDDATWKHGTEWPDAAIDDECQPRRRFVLVFRSSSVRSLQKYTHH